MTKYGNKGSDSGVSGYEIHDNGITVEFSTGAQYLYTNESAGKANIDTVKELAVGGEGLNGFINKYVKKLYQSQLR